MKKYNVTVTRLEQYTILAPSLEEAIAQASPAGVRPTSISVQVSEAYDQPYEPAAPSPDEVEHGR